MKEKEWNGGEKKETEKKKGEGKKEEIPMQESNPRPLNLQLSLPRYASGFSCTYVLYMHVYISLI